MTIKPIISVNGLSKKFFIGSSRQEGKNHGLLDTLLIPYRLLFSEANPFTNNSKDFIWALSDINFDIQKGEKVGVIGRNGAGKSTLLSILSRLIYPTKGSAVIRGRVTSLLGLGTGFNHNLTGKENIYLNASLHGLEKYEIDQKLNEIIEFSEIGKFINTPVKYYSTGMFMRLALMSAEIAESMFSVIALSATQQPL